MWQSLGNGDRFSLLPNDLVFKVMMKQGEEERLNLTAEARVHEVDVGCKEKLTAPLTTDDALFGPDDTLQPHLPAERNGDHNVKPSHVTRDATPENVGYPVKDEATAPVRMSSPVRMSPPLKPSHTTDTHCGSISGEEPCKATQPVDRSIEACVRQHSTNKPRTLPSWLANIEVEGKPAKKKVKKEDDGPSTAPVVKKPAVKGRIQSQESADKPKAKSKVSTPPPSASGSHGDHKSHVPSEEAHSSVGRTITPEPASREMKGVDKATKPAPMCDTSAAPSRATAVLPSALPLCPYGNKCYRKNPAHFREYSHPSVATPTDTSTTMPSDDESEKPECPYGTDCYRTNPAHRAEYKHSEPPKQRPKRQPTRRSNKQSALEGESDDDDQPNTYDYNDSFIDDEDDGGEEESSYGDEDDMDWAPDDNSEDVAELLTDAKSFLSNRKLHKPT